jgi:hypothetical protein
MQRLREHQRVVIVAGDAVAECRVAAIADAAAALVVVRQGGHGPLPDGASDAELAFEHGPGLVVLRGTLTRGATGEDLRFAVTDGVQLAARRRNSRLRVEVPVTLRHAGGAELATVSADLSATGVGVQVTGVADRGARLRVRIELPDGGPVEAVGTVVRVAGGVTAFDLHDFVADGRERLGAFVLARQRAAAAAAEPVARAA